MRALQRPLLALGVAWGALFMPAMAGAASTTTVHVALTTANKINLGVSAHALIRVAGLSGPAVVVGSLLHASGPTTCGTQNASSWARSDVVRSVSATVDTSGAYTLVAGVPGAVGCYSWSVGLYINGVQVAQVAPGGDSEVEVVARVVATTTTSQPVTTQPVTTTHLVTTTTHRAVTTTTRAVTTTTFLITDSTTTSLPVNTTTLPGTTATLPGATTPHHSSNIWLVVILALVIIYFTFDILTRRRRR